MRIVLEHLKARTIPHELLEDLYKAGVHWYDGNLLVEVNNHRVKGAPAGGSSTNQVGATDHIPYSIHNYNEHITPSPFGKFPEHKLRGVPAPAEGDVKAEKEKMPAPEQPASAMSKKGVAPPEVHRVFLRPTQLSQMEDLNILSQTPYQDPPSHKPGGFSATPTMAHPSPMTPVPPTPKMSNHPRMMIDETNVHEWESLIVNNTAPPLILQPAKSFEESQAIIDVLADPCHSELPPPPKGRKRTMAELEADEAQAATQERFMLSCDDRHTSMLSSNANGAAGEASRAGAAGEAQFKRFRLIESLKLQQVESKRVEAEKDSQRASLKRQQAEADARKARERDAVMEQQSSAARESHAQRQAYMQQQQLMAAQRQAQVAQQQQQAATQQAMQQQTPVTTMAQQQMTPMTSAPQHSMQQPTSQANHMSPAVRQQTPMSGSPTIGNGTPMPSAPVTSAPMMAASASNQGAGSPARPPSTVQHGSSMIRQASQQLGSAHGTPQMHSTPSMASAAPVTRHMTPTPRVNQHGSPMPNQMGTPQMGINTPVPGFPPEQNNQLMMRRAAMQQQNGQQGMPQNMSPQQINQMMQMRQAQMGTPQQGMNPQMNPQMMAAQAQANAMNQMRASQASPQQSQVAQQMAMLGPNIERIFQGIPPIIQQRLHASRVQMQTQLAQEENNRRQGFLQMYHNQGIPPPQEMQMTFNNQMQKFRAETTAKIRNQLGQQRVVLIQQFQAAQAAGQGGQQMPNGMHMNNAQQNQVPQTPGGGQQQINPQNEAYMRQLLQTQNQIRQRAMLNQAQNPGGQQGGQQRMGMPPQQNGQAQAMMNAQMMQQMGGMQAMQAAGGGAPNMNSMTPQQQQAFMQQMRMAQMQQQQQNGGQQMNGMGGNMGMM